MTMIDAPNPDAPPVDQDVMAEIQDMYGQADYRANVPAGTVLAEHNVQGSIFREKKGSSLAVHNGVPLPERTKVYDTRTGLDSLVPTRSLYYQLGKRRFDGSRVYSLQYPEDVPVRTPIKDTCQICLPRRNGVWRNFYTEQDLFDHMLAMHEREWNAMERQRETDARREDATRMERLITTISQAMRPDIKLDPEVKEQIAEMQAKVAAVTDGHACDECVFVAKNAFGLRAHKRGKHGGE